MGFGTRRTFLADAAFKYARYLVTHKVPPTRSQSLREALGFAKGYVGLQGVDEVLASRRVTGSVQESLDARAERVPRDTLRVDMVRFLEGLMVESATEVKVLVGFLLFFLHSRARVGDALRADREPPRRPGRVGRLRLP